MKKTLGSLVVLAVMMAGIGSVEGADVYTASTFQDYIRTHGPAGEYSDVSYYWSDIYTFDGLPSEDIYVIGLSRFPDGNVYLNVVGKNGGNGTYLDFWVYGDGVFTSVLAMYVIVDNGDKELFSVNGITGQLNLGLDGDQVFTSESISINGGVFGDVSVIKYDPTINILNIGSVAVETPPVVLTSPENGSTSILPSDPLVWQGDASSEFEVHLYDDQGGPVYVFPDLTDTSLDVSSYLDWNTTYNWKVDEVIGGEVTYSSPVWTFTIIDYECQTVIAGDVNNDCVVNLADIALVASNWLTDTPKIPKGSGE